MIKRFSKIGFSTAELLVTIMIFSFGLLPLIILFQNSHKQTAQAKNPMIAQSIGRTKIAEIRAYGYDILSDEIDHPTSHDIIHSDKEVAGRVVSSDEDSIEYPEPYVRFKTTVSLERGRERTINGENRPSNTIIVNLIVEWQEPSRKFSLGFGTIVVKYDT